MEGVCGRASAMQAIRALRHVRLLSRAMKWVHGAGLSTRSYNAAHGATHSGRAPRRINAISQTSCLLETNRGVKGRRYPREGEGEDED